LRQQAIKEHRSIAQQAVVALAKGLKTSLNIKERRNETISELRKNKDRVSAYKLSDPVVLIRKDREI
jgi:hypothetical protein